MCWLYEAEVPEAELHWRWETRRADSVFWKTEKVRFESADEKELFGGREGAGGTSESQRIWDMKTNRREYVILQWAMFQARTSSYGLRQVVWSHISHFLTLKNRIKSRQYSLWETLRNSESQVPLFKHGILRSTYNSFLIFSQILNVFFYLTIISS